MGAWGVGPFESDQALDWVGNEISDFVLEKLQRTVMQSLDDIDLSEAVEVQAAAFMFLSLVGHESRVLGEVDPETIIDFSKKAIEALEKLNASKWAEEWRSPDEYRQANQRLITKFTGLIESNADA